MPFKLTWTQDPFTPNTTVLGTDFQPSRVMLSCNTSSSKGGRLAQQKPSLSIAKKLLSSPKLIWRESGSRPSIPPEMSNLLNLMGRFFSSEGSVRVAANLVSSGKSFSYSARWTFLYSCKRENIGLLYQRQDKEALDILILGTDVLYYSRGKRPMIGSQVRDNDNGILQSAYDFL
jgi:hypothetical protein